MKKKKIIAIIPARKNSTRLKNKNFKKFNGQPLIKWTIESALKSKYINKILVSSDSKKILNFCSNYKGIIASKRAKQLSLKNSKIEDVIENEIIKNSLQDFDYFILLQPTSPLRTVKSINESLEMISKSKASSCVSFYKIKENYINVYRIKDTKIKKANSQKNIIRKSNYFIPSGDIYISKVKSFLNDKKFIRVSTLPYIIKHGFSDIDYLHEFKSAETIHKKNIYSSK